MEQSYMGLNSRSLITAALIAGVGIGLLSGIPVISCVNCLLFAWVWGGGIAAVGLYRRNTRLPAVTITQGIVLGASAGIVGGLLSGLLTLLFSGLTTALSAYVEQTMGSGSDAIPNLLFASGFSIIGLIGRIVLYAVLGAVGGIIATALIWKVPAAPMAPPPTYTPPAGPSV